MSSNVSNPSIISAISVNSDRALGCILGLAAGDALGVGYEFNKPLPSALPIEMIGREGFEPGEWSDDTAMSIPIIDAGIASQGYFGDHELDLIAEGWFTWFEAQPKGIGQQIFSVINASHCERTAQSLAKASAMRYRQIPNRSAGNGSLMRTAPVVLPNLDRETVADAAGRISLLTHGDPIASEACVIWSVGIAHAIEYGSFDGIDEGVGLLPVSRRSFWNKALKEAQHRAPNTFRSNGWVVQALQGAWSAITTTKIPFDDPSRHLQLAMEAAVRGGGDTDTVAAIAGSLLGARWGLSAIPESWIGKIHGYPGLSGFELIERILSGYA
ncbi:ADP-ribosylglycohydrolase family protein [Arcanobacterium buesumense]|uniref:ADP-ribosylglycohydrolase family protein n=1 Tax=Arcanobacterium buesumense TaxID=2722751 RepID=A0A6H2EM57_9ACTO|nr:ADP-ribosylglycohydrolase family protein [Arcanobacterium buesumense]QJC22151.1 ADP-ribosylglycohydrolase family protein [Arcanobacterium buesumense]